MAANTDDEQRPAPAPGGPEAAAPGGPRAPGPDEPAPAGGDRPPAGPRAGWRRWLPRRRPAPAATTGAEPPSAGEVDVPAAAPEPADAVAPPPRVEGPGRLRRRRRHLLARREEAVYHLGGLAFELYRRDMLSEDVMRRRAGEVALLDDAVRDIDARLGELERERRARRRRRAPEEEPAGNCIVCRAPFRAEARFCWQCGARLAPHSEGDEQVTAVIGARPRPGGDGEGGAGEGAPT